MRKRRHVETVENPYLRSLRRNVLRGSEKKHTRGNPPKRFHVCARAQTFPRGGVCKRFHVPAFRDGETFLGRLPVETFFDEETFTPKTWTWKRFRHFPRGDTVKRSAKTCNVSTSPKRFHVAPPEPELAKTFPRVVISTYVETFLLRRHVETFANSAASGGRRPWLPLGARGEGRDVETFWSS